MAQWRQLEHVRAARGTWASRKLRTMLVSEVNPIRAHRSAPCKRFGAHMNFSNQSASPSGAIDAGIQTVERMSQSVVSLSS